MPPKAADLEIAKRTLASNAVTLVTGGKPLTASYTLPRWSLIYRRNKRLSQAERDLIPMNGPQIVARFWLFSHAFFLCAGSGHATDMGRTISTPLSLTRVALPTWSQPAQCLAPPNRLRAIQDHRRQGDFGQRALSFYRTIPDCRSESHTGHEQCYRWIDNHGWSAQDAQVIAIHIGSPGGKLLATIIYRRDKDNFHDVIQNFGGNSE
jgi:hypothetical protein